MSESPRASKTRPTLVILGRPNVGKSTLFNRLLGRRRALVHNTPGVTRDLVREEAVWILGGRQYRFELVDSGGIGGELFDEEIRAQVRRALQEADLAMVVFDSQSGYTPADRELMSELYRSGLTERTPVIGIVNKVDDAKHLDTIGDFYESGLEPLLGVSAEHDLGVDELQEKVHEMLKPEPLPEVCDEETDFEKEADRGEKEPGVAIIGRPNAGKSTLMNALLQEEKVVTSSIAGTTVDTVEAQLRIGEKHYRLTDTAGIRRKSKTEKGIEVLSVVQAKKALDRADLAILMVDGERGPEDQDEKIAGEALDAGCSLVIAVNKWDLFRGKDFDEKTAADQIRRRMRFLGFVPIVFISAKEKRGLKRLGEAVEAIMEQRDLKIPTSEFTEWIRRQVDVNNPKKAKFYLSHQVGRNPPSFICHVNDPRKVHFSLKRNLVNGIRDRWGFMGTPIRLSFHKSRGKNT